MLWVASTLDAVEDNFGEEQGAVSYHPDEERRELID